MKDRIILTYLLLIFGSALFSQNENKKWYFGHGAALDFMTSPPTNIAGSSMSVTGGCASVANSAGALLFYTDAKTVWTQTNSVMANGTGLFGANGDAQALIVKKPSSSTIYYIFTVDGGYSSVGFNYSEVDMSLAAGMGSVTIKNFSLYPNYCGHKLTGTLHNNGTDIWVLTHEMNSNNFRSHLVTSTGVSTVGIISSVGTYYPPYEVTGHMKISPNGRKIGLCVAGAGSQQELYDFDNNTGIVSNPLILPNSFGGWGQDFSPDGTKFYGTIYANSQYYLSQWNLCAGSNSAIAASQYTILSGSTNLHSMQLAPDGKIYLARNQQTDLGVINNPNVLGSGCNYVNLGLSLSPKYTWFSIPNFITSTTVNIMPNNLNITGNTSLCAGQSTTLTASGAISYTWNTTSTNSSIIVSPTLNTYYSLASNANPTCPISITTTVSVYPNPTISIAGNFLICIGETVTLSASGANSYQWNTSVNSPSISVTPVVNTTYSTVGTTTNGCTGYSLKTVTVNSLPNVTASATNSMVCIGDFITFNGSGALTYSWSNGVINNVPFLSLTSNIYTVTGSDNNNCKSTATVNVLVNPLPTIIVTSQDSVVCTGQFAVLHSAGANTYTWNTGFIGTPLVVAPIVTTNFVVTGTGTNGCTHTVGITQYVDQCLALDKNNLSNYRIYPNPNNGNFTIDLRYVTKNATIEIADSFGQIIYNYSVQELKTEITLNAVTSGLYFIRIIERNNSHCIKINIQK